MGERLRRSSANVPNKDTRMRIAPKGYNNREIAQSLHIAEKTVKNYVTNILNQLNLRDRTQLAIAALKAGFPDL